ncbi:MAG: hypothetical protein Q607_CBUC00221G0002, partial [Clostridium butyricum DORA_1]
RRKEEQDRKLKEKLKKHKAEK